MAAHRLVLVICLLLPPWLITEAANALQKTEIAKPNCTDRCGDVNIPYPFGIEVGCYMNEWFRVTCKKDKSNIGNDSNPKPFISSINLELLDVSFSSGTVLVSNPVSKLNCSNNGLLPFSINLESTTGSPFFFSNVHNRFASTGCGRLTTIVHNQTDMGGCLLPDCSDDDDKARVNGCQVRIPPNLNSFVAKSIELFPGRDEGNNNNNSCGSAFMIADSMLNPDGSLPGGINNLTHVPAVLQWSIPKHSICDPKGGSYNMFCDGNGFCWTNLSSTHLCVCSNSYQDNSQLSNDCQGTNFPNSLT
ncbi:hypothetical protein CCACVL1_15981 [Corchorus capsularis]|uniref:Wall-associated receptor kinase galacturonan-binding domain-containing protein n=1 Tax=Corchorus capsularis TaxID=210143 RepID=A0A1R3I0A8_COCAP|nr:hypothetical protein CCACVL1_15981 [Corchorus capsularis]